MALIPINNDDNMTFLRRGAGSRTTNQPFCLQRHLSAVASSIRSIDKMYIYVDYVLVVMLSRYIHKYTRSLVSCTIFWGFQWLPAHFKSVSITQKISVVRKKNPRTTDVSRCTNSPISAEWRHRIFVSPILLQVVPMKWRINKIGQVSICPFRGYLMTPSVREGTPRGRNHFWGWTNKIGTQDSVWL